MHLTESYGGSKINFLNDRSYFCYTVYDSERSKFYSGSRGLRGSTTHDVGITYFTSSVVTDFVKRFKEHPEKFALYVEYFCSRHAAFEAEAVFHRNFNVGANSTFYNVCNQGGTVCGAGTVLCVRLDGSTYRISSEEYQLNRQDHKTPSTGKANARNILTNEVKKLPLAEICGDWISDISGVVVALNKDGKRCRISKEYFDANRDQFKGVTAGKAPMLDLITGKRRMVAKEEQNANPNRFAGVTKGLTSGIDVVTGEKVTMTSKEYQVNDSVKHFNTGKVSVYDTRDRTTKKVTQFEFKLNKQFYSNGACPVYWEFDGQIVASREYLNTLFKAKFGKNLPRIKSRELWQADPSIKVIEK